MELLNAFVNFLVSHRDLVTSDRPVRLRLDHPKLMMEDVLLPQRVEGHESLCGGFEYRVLCVALDARLPLKEFIALPAAIDIVNDRGRLRTVCGVVTEARAGDTDGGLASYQLVIRDMLAVMEKRTNTRVFRNLNEVEILYRLRDEWHHSNPVVGPSFDVITDNIFDDMKYPKREFTMQHNESDAAFIRRILRRRGISWIFEPDVGNQYPSHRMRLLNRFESVRANAAGTVRYHRDAATEERDSITAWTAVRTLQPMSATRHSWNYKTPLSLDAMRVGMLGQLEQGSVERTLAATLDDYQVWSPHAGDDRKDLTALGELAMDRHDFETKCFMGEGAVRDFRAGEHFTLTGHPEIDRHQAIDREFVITELQLAVQNNLPRDLADRVARLFARSGWAGDDLGKRPVKMRFTAVRRGVPIVPAYDPRTDLPPVHMQSALVVGPAKEEVHCDAMGRVRIRFPATREQDHAHASGTGATQTDRDSAWVRVASSWAGNGPGYDQCGAVMLPRVGSEVLVAFLGGDPDKPVIVGQMFNQVTTPPELSSGGGLPGNRYLSGIRSREVLGGRKGNQLRFDDTKGQISAQLSSDHGESQLNLGFLTQPKKNGYAEKRGEGAELFSELAVAVRGVEGVLITAENGGGSEGKQLERAGLTKVAAGIGKLAGQLSKLAERFAEDEPIGTELSALVEKVEKIDQVKGRVIAINGPDGVIATSGQSLAIGAALDTDLVCSEQMRLSAGGSTWIRAARGVSLFTNQGGAKLIAAGGKVQIQAQNDELEVLAKKVIEIISATDWINLKAKKGVRINGGGSELVLSADGIKGYTSGDSEMYAAGHQTMKGQDRKATFPGSDTCAMQAKGAAGTGAATVPVKGE
ncbi:type VI secretion system Vgr family protein [Pseudoduganella umbonata]|uniref:Type VI secretion system secreted protein VgrG n=1 Tax=Pseudoduganella umbonata TaxID=864828 RepID=A0A4P8HUV9_9BURK|nr:type VI secretion system Vgr family protein [Pseudoduganella umbonata]MBB3225238.1 type VI secretion system secreted protein VgrG [Pseudoduganella umbonata]QCP12255.1 type VI secretion system tip protein VgrG [Pseudoduganella umbonata]